MADYKIVDAEKLDSDLRSVADSVRAKGKTYENLSFPDGFRSAIDDIKTQKEEQTKFITTSENGEYVITPDEGKVLSSATVNVSARKEEQEKTLNVYENGYYTITPDEGKVLSSAKVNVDYGRKYQGTINVKMFPERSEYINPKDGYLFSSIELRADSTRGFIQALIGGQGGTYTHIELPTWLTALTSCAFYGSSFESIIIPPSITQISNQAFGFMNELRSITFQGIPGYFVSSVFQDTRYLEEVNIPEGWNKSIYLQWTSELTQECLHSMIENFADLTGLTTQTFRIGEVNIAKIDEDHISILEAKGWDYS